MTWREEYSQAIWGLDINKATNIKNQALVDLGYSLYRYRSFNENNLQAVENKEMWMSYPEDFNDPFEFEFDLKLNKSTYDICKNIPGLISNLEKMHRDKIEDFRQQTLKQFALCCFMEDNTSELMWSHYAEGHRGFCVEYDFSESKFYNFVHPVCYRNLVYALENSDNQDRYFPVMITKSSVWSYENEWRVIFSGRDHGLHASPNIRAIYLGVKVSDKNRQKMIKICKKKSINLYQMRIKPGTYEIFEEKIAF